MINSDTNKLVPADFLKDESGIIGTADSIYYPSDTEQLFSVVRQLNDARKQITIQGARTGICGGAVPNDSAVVNLSRMKAVLGFRFNPVTSEALLLMDPGLTLEDLIRMIQSKNLPQSSLDETSKAHILAFQEEKIDLCFPPDPTELSATVGGLVSCNASGSHMYYYGSLNHFVQAIEVIQPDNLILFEQRAWHGVSAPFMDSRIQQSMMQDTFEGIRGLNSLIVGSSDYQKGSSSDAIDIICGSEGTLGIISKIALRLVKKPRHIWSVLLYFEELPKMIKFIGEIELVSASFSNQHITAIDFWHRSLFTIINQCRSKLVSLQSLPNTPTIYEYTLYLEYAGDFEESMTGFLEVILCELNKYSPFADEAVAATDSIQVERFKSFWHSAIEASNFFDQSCERAYLGHLMIDVILDRFSIAQFVESALIIGNTHGFKFVVMGHIGIGHIHIRILHDKIMSPEFLKEQLQCLCVEAVRIGGTIGKEFGIGRTKRDCFKQLSEKVHQTLSFAKAIIDPDNRYNRDVMV